MFSCKEGHTSGSNITKKMFWWNSFCNNYTKIITKILVPRNSFIIISARMVHHPQKGADSHLAPEPVYNLVSSKSAIGDTISCDAPYSAIGFRGKLFLQ